MTNISGCLMIRAFYAFLLFFFLFVSSIDAENTGSNGDSILQKKNVNFLDQISHLGENIIDKVTWEYDSFVFTAYPSGSVSPRNGIVLGVMPSITWDSQLSGKINSITLNGEASTSGLWQLQLEHEFYLGKAWLIKGENYIIKRLDKYWPADKQADFSFNRREIRNDITILNQLWQEVWFGGNFILGHNQLNLNLYSESSHERLVGSDGGWLFGVGPRLVLDSRQRTLAPQSGHWIEMTALLGGPFGSGDFHYTRYTTDVRKYFAIKEEKSTIAFQMIIDFSGAGAPFYEKPFLGGKNRLRGIGHPLQYTGDAVWLARAEWRQHLWWRFGGVLFFGAGKASQNFKDPFSGIISSFGGGLRLRMLEETPLNARIDFAMSTAGTTGFFISLKEAF